MSKEYKPHPLRIRRTRTGGSKMDDSAIYVGRPSKWGNPYKPEQFTEPGGAVEAFRVLMESEDYNIEMIQRELKGKVLACWCPLDKPCHADVLAEIANQAVQASASKEDTDAVS